MRSDREGILIDILIDKVICFFLDKSRSKIFLQTMYVLYKSQHMLLAGLKVPFV